MPSEAAARAAPGIKDEIEDCLDDPGLFIDCYCQITTPAGNDEEVGNPDTAVPFHLWPAQVRALDTVHRSLQVIFLKARRLGLTWLVLAYALWLCLFHENRSVGIFSKGLDPAINLIARIRFMWERLPELMRVPLVEDQKKKLRFRNGSWIQSFPDTPHGGRQETFSLVILDEHAFHRYADQAWAAIKPTIEGGGKIVIISTNDLGTLFARIWKKARAGKNKFTAVFLDCYARPDRTRDWREKERSDYEGSDTQFDREYPEIEADAFQSPQGQFFSMWDPDTHIIKPGGYEVEDTWPIWRCVDFGYNRPAVLYIQETPRDDAVIVGELRNEGRTTQELAGDMKSYEERRGFRNLKGACIDPAGVGVNVQTGETDIEVFNAAGIPTIIQRSARKEGCDLIRWLLKKNKLFVCTEWCEWIVESFGGLVNDKNTAGVLKSECYRDDEELDHVMEALRRYVVVRWRKRGGRNSQVETPPRPVRKAQDFDELPDTALDDVRPGRKGRPTTAGIRRKQW